MRIQFSLQTLVIFVLGLGGILFLCPVSVKPPDHLIGWVEVVDGMGVPWNVEVYSRPVSLADTHRQNPVITVFARSPGGSAHFVHETGWCYGPSRPEVHANGVEVYWDYFFPDTRGIRLELIDDKWELVSPFVFRIKSLHQAAMEGSDTAIDRLMLNGHLVDSLGPSGHTPLQLAVLNGSHETVWHLLYYYEPNLELMAVTGESVFDMAQDEKMKALLWMKNNRRSQDLWDMHDEFQHSP